MYPSLQERTKALLIDGVILISALILTSDLLSTYENIPNLLKKILFVFYFILYEPLFLSITGGTIGHNLAGIKVKQNKNHDKNISFFAGIIRYAVKFILGWFSFITLFTSDNKRAVHDKLSGSIVLYK